MDLTTLDTMKPVPGYEGSYSIGPDGRVWGFWRNDWRKLTKDIYGYMKLHAWTGKRIQQISVHRLVAQAFIPNPESKRCINHKNGDKTDNRVENLEWVTHSENTRHAIRTGLLTIRRGEKVHTAKLTESDVVAIRKEYAAGGVSQAQLTRRYRLGEGTICNLLNRKTWRYL